MAITIAYYCPKVKGYISFCLEDIDKQCRYLIRGECTYEKGQVRQVWEEGNPTRINNENYR